MAKKTPADPEPPVTLDADGVPELDPEPEPPITLAEATAGPGDPVVWVRLLGGGDIQRCYARDGKRRQILIDGRPCEHVGDGPDGAWLYAQRAF